MRKAKVNHVYFFSNIPYELTLAFAFKSVFSRCLTVKEITLIQVMHPFFDNVDADWLFRKFPNVVRLPFCDYFPNILRGFRQRNIFLEALTRLQYVDNSVYIILSKSELTSNLFVRDVRRRARKPNVITFDLEFNKDAESLYGGTVLAWCLHNLYCLKNGYALRVFIKNHVVIARTYYNPKVFDKIVLLHGSSCPNAIRPPFEASEMGGSEYGSVRMVFFFGDAYWYKFFGVGKGIYIETINSVLRKISEVYSAMPNIELYYKPHPGDDGEVPFDLCNFRLYEKKHTAEMIYLAVGRSIEAVYSVCSTASISASLYGLNAFWVRNLLRCDRCTDDLLSEFKGMGGNVVDINDINDIRDLRRSEGTAENPEDDEVMLRRLGIPWE